MDRKYLEDYDKSQIESPAFIIDIDALKRNLQVLDCIQRDAGVNVLLALKGFSTVKAFDSIKQVLKGVCASSLHEARLGREYFGKEVHTYSPAYQESKFDEIVSYSDHLVFNSVQQWEQFREKCPSELSVGLRLNPEHSETETPLYDPCAPGSRLGIRSKDLEGVDLSGVEGFHMHTLCQRDSFALERTFEAAEKKFGHHFQNLKWLNFGGGHKITHKDYDVDHLITFLKKVKSDYNLEIYLEPGEAVVWETGLLLCTVLDIVPGDIPSAILDISVTCHMPDVLEMPYQPDLEGATIGKDKKYAYRLGGMSCLAGDVAGVYSFDKPLEIGQQLEFLDMSQYTTVKTTTFNGVALPSVYSVENKGVKVNKLQEFGYKDFLSRLL